MHILSLDGSGPFGYMQLFLLNDIMNISTLLLRSPKQLIEILSRLGFCNSSIKLQAVENI